MIVIGEKINATRAPVRSIIEQRRTGDLLALAREQIAAGASVIDVNVGTGSGTQQDEIDAIRWAVKALIEETDKALAIDSADPDVLEAGLEACGGRPAWINSVKAEHDFLARVAPLAVRFDASVIALAMDAAGIPKTVEGRLQACRAIAAFCRESQAPLSKMYFDPLVIPVVTDGSQGRVTLDTIAAVKSALPEAKTVMGLSNVSYGLPGRAGLNAAFLQMAAFAGLDAVIMDPTTSALSQAVLTGEALLGRDRHFRRYTRALREKLPN